MSLEKISTSALDRLLRQLNIDEERIIKSPAGSADALLGKAEKALFLFNKAALARLAALRLTRNSLTSPIYKLPIEILSYILMLVVEFVRDEESSLNCLSSMAPRPWDVVSITRTVISLAKVSSAWHEIVMTCPQLWDKVDLSDNINLIRMSLKNSAAVPLSILLGFRGEWMRMNRRDAAICEVMKHAKRWVSADLLLTYREINILTRISAPNLQHLQLTPIIPNSFNEYSPPLLNLPPPKHLFQGRLHKLKTLHLTYWSGWEDVELPQLRRLKICNDKDEGNSISKLLVLLSRCPKLESFLSRAPWPPMIGEELYRVRRVALPHLKEILLERCNQSAAWELLYCLDLPRSLEFLGVIPFWTTIEPPHFGLFPSLTKSLNAMTEGAEIVYLALRKAQIIFTFNPFQSYSRTLLVETVPWAVGLAWALTCEPTLRELIKGLVIGPDTSGLNGCRFENLREAGSLLPLSSITWIAVEQDAPTFDILSVFLQINGLAMFAPRVWPELRNIWLVGCHCRALNPTPISSIQWVRKTRAANVLGWMGNDIYVRHTETDPGPRLQCSQCETSNEDWETYPNDSENATKGTSERNIALRALEVLPSDPCSF